INALKNWLSAVIYSVAVATFVLADAVSLPHTLVMIGTATIGGYAGAAWARRIPALWLRRFIIVFGAVLSAWYFRAALAGGAAACARGIARPHGCPVGAGQPMREAHARRARPRCTPGTPRRDGLAPRRAGSSADPAGSPPSRPLLFRLREPRCRHGREEFATRSVARLPGTPRGPSHADATGCSSRRFAHARGQRRSA